MELILQEAQEIYKTEESFPSQKETFEIIGICMEIHRILGRGFKEVVYKDAMQHEFSARAIAFEREKKFEINYKDIILPHYYYADFVVFGNILVEVKAQAGSVEDHYKQILNYLAAAKIKLGLIINFGEDSLKFKRVVL